MSASGPAIKCPVCLLPYGGSLLPVVGTCGHSICCHCRTLLQQGKACPVCRHPCSFSKKIRNYVAEELLLLAGIAVDTEIKEEEEGEEMETDGSDFSGSDADSFTGSEDEEEVEEEEEEEEGETEQIVNPLIAFLEVLRRKFL